MQKILWKFKRIILIKSLPGIDLTIAFIFSCVRWKEEETSPQHHSIHNDQVSGNPL